jgi:hypothetical protein
VTGNELTSPGPHLLTTEWDVAEPLQICRFVAMALYLLQKCDLYKLQTPNVDISVSTGL